MDEEFCGSTFWNLNVSSNSSSTIQDLTDCFQDTILIWVPCAFLLFFTPFYIFSLKTVKNIGHTWLNITKTVFSVLLIILTIVDICYSLHERSVGHRPYPAHLLAPCITFVAMCVSVLLIQFGRTRGAKVSGLLFLYWLLQLIAAVIFLQSRIRFLIFTTNKFSIYHLAYSSLFITFVAVQTILSGLFVDLPRESTKTDANECPEITACFLSILSFWWFTSMIIKGYRKSLERSDLWSAQLEHRSKSVIPIFEKQWKLEMKKFYNSSAKEANSTAVAFKEPEVNILLESMNEKEKENSRSNNGGDKKKKVYGPSLWIALARAFGRTFLFGSFLKLIHDILMFVSPYLLQRIIIFIGTENAPDWEGYVYALLIFAVAFFQSMFLHQYFHICMVIGMNVRTALVGIIYKKSLKLSNAARKKSTIGEIVNLMSADAQRFMELTTYLNMLWSAPFQMCVCLYYLWMVLGPSILAGVAVMILLIPVNAVIARKTKEFQTIQMKHKDSRIKLMNEILNGIKVLKLYAWEGSFQKKVLDIRQKELDILRKTSYLNAVSSFTWNCSPFMVSLTTFAVYVLSSPENVLNAEKAFVSLSLFNILRFPLSMLPMLIANMVQTSVSVKRLRTFLTNEELDESSVIRKIEEKAPAVSVENGTFCWDTSDDKKPTLENINLKVEKGAFIGIVGQVGCGKSSLFSSILGETEKIDGSVMVNGSIAYVAQQAWMQNASIESNILFGQEKNKEKYEKVLDACALRPDLELLPGRDETEIGEKGINLSGGQKQRISLARACYIDADVYLLDDTLSAVDAHVGKHIFDQVLSKNGLLKDKTRLFVTHGISYLPQFDFIVVMVDGRISEVGTYTELLNQNGAFAEFLQTYILKEVESEDVIIDEKELQLREEILQHIGGSMNANASIEKIARLRRDTSKSESPTTPRSPRTFTPMNSVPHDAAVSKSEELMNGKAGEDASEKDGLLASDTDADAKKSIIDTYRARAMSIESSKSKTSEKKKSTEKLPLMEKNDKRRIVQDEKMEIGRVKFSIFFAYMKSIGIPVALSMIILYMVNIGFSIYSNFWLSYWSNDKPLNGTIDMQLTQLRLGVYGALGLGQSVAVLLAAIIMAQGALHASRNLHLGILENGLRAPMSFFDSTPIGRIINRFAKDIDIIDTMIPSNLDVWTKCTLSVFATLFVISFSTPMFMAVILPLGIIYYLVQRFYVATSRQLKRLESISRSPIFSHFGETVQGASTIRAYGQQDRFILESEARVDENIVCYYPGLASNRWLAVRLEFVGNAIVFFAALFAINGRHHLTAGIVGLSITYALNITQTLNWMVRMTSEVETNIVAVERVKEYSDNETEAEWVNENNRPSPDWPNAGRVEFKTYSMSYRKELEPVLKSINVVINPGEKVGIVGRTGAGKSSLTIGLFRIVEPSAGSIVIDGVDVAHIGLHDLRSKLTIIPQDPVLFSGSLRMNLDPFDKYTDEEVWTSLKYAHLENYAKSNTDGLLYECGEGGVNLSLGQRQLVCLARALLRKSQILVLDEATAAVDLETDDLIQSTIRTQFSDSTIITIAHRINTIMDYTRILVLDYGEVKEFDSPQVLLSRKDGLFYSLAKEAGLVE